MNTSESIVLSDELWRAILQNDSSYDGIFYYAVETTGIFCRPSCKSRPPARKNVVIFRSAAQALRHSFRPCKRCKPENHKLPEEEWIEKAISLIKTRYAEPLTLSLLAELLHVSPYHLHRTFKRVKGITPADYMKQIRISRAMEALSQTNKPITEIAHDIGIMNSGHFATWFHKKTGFTPSEYRHLNSKERNSIGGIHYGKQPS